MKCYNLADCLLHTIQDSDFKQLLSDFPWYICAIAFAKSDVWVTF